MSRRDLPPPFDTLINGAELWRITSEINRRRAEDWDASVGWYSVIGDGKPHAEPPRENGFTAKPAQPMRQMSRAAEIDMDLARRYGLPRRLG